MVQRFLHLVRDWESGGESVWESVYMCVPGAWSRAHMGMVTGVRTWACAWPWACAWVWLWYGMPNPHPGRRGNMHHRRRANNAVGIGDAVGTPVGIELGYRSRTTSFGLLPEMSQLCVTSVAPCES